MNTLEELEKFDSYLHDLIKIHFEQYSAEILRMYDLLNLLELMKEIYPNLESNLIMDEVKTDLFSSIYLATKGMYRNSFISLRSSLELGIGYLYFIDNNLDYIKWTNNKFDLSWSRLNDENYGVLRKNYLKLFKPNLNESDYEGLINNCKEIYRVCSEYTHGKYGFMKTNIDTKYIYNGDYFKEFIETFNEVVKTLISLQSIRFSRYLIDISEEILDDIQIILKEKNLEGV